AGSRPAPAGHVRHDPRDDLPALPPGGGAVHAGDAQGAGGGLRAAARAAPARGHPAGALPVRGSRAGARAGRGPARPVLIRETTTSSPGETEACAARVAALLEPGDVV